MPVVSLTLEENNRSVLSAAYYKIVQDIVDAVKIPYGALVVMHRDTEVTLTDNKTNVSNLSNPNLPSTVSNRRVQVSINEEYNEDELTTTMVHQPSSYPIFFDPEISVSVYPVYVKSDITIEFSYISPSKIEANRIRDDIRLRLSQMRNINIHEVDYNILIPTIVEDFIGDVYDLKSRLKPQSLEQYFGEHSTNRIHAITDMSNKENTKLAIYEKQVRIVGTYDFSSMPEKVTVDQENNTHKVSFNYKFSMDVPRAMVMRYPVLICNKPLPSKYLSFIEDAKINSKEEYKKELGYTSGLQSLSYFEAHRQLENRIDIKLPINIPLFDDFNKRQGRRGYAIVVSFLTQVDETDNKTLLNLRDLDPYYIPEQLLTYIKDHERKLITQPYQSFMYLGLHQEDRHFDNSILEIDENLNVKSRVVLSLLKPVRVTLSVCIDTSRLQANYLIGLRDFPGIYLTYLIETIRTLNNFKTEADYLAFIDNTFIRELITTIHYYTTIDKWDIISQILEVINQDKYISVMFSKILVKGYPDLYRTLLYKFLLYIEINNYQLYLLRGQKFELITKTGAPNSFNQDILHYNKALSISRHLLPDNTYRAEIETRAMKTLMSNYVFVARKD